MHRWIPTGSIEAIEVQYHDTKVPRNFTWAATGPKSIARLGLSVSLRERRSEATLRCGLPSVSCSGAATLKVLPRLQHTLAPSCY